MFLYPRANQSSKNIDFSEMYVNFSQHILMQPPTNQVNIAVILFILKKSAIYRHICVSIVRESYHTVMVATGRHQIWPLPWLVVDRVNVVACLGKIVINFT